MTTLSEVMSLELLEKMLEDGYVRMQRHPKFPELVIYNYAEKAVFERAWNEVTLQCRGLIVNETTGIVLARPLRKFFNLSEYGPDWTPPVGPIEVSEKYDGSLGILYLQPDGIWAVATRGSFASEQALMATEILHNKYPGWSPCCGTQSTYVVEIIYPTNRIVVNYGDMEDLVLLDVIGIFTGDRSEGCFVDPNWTGPRTQTFPFRSLSEAAAAPQVANAEGFVVLFSNGERVKIKFPDYVALHAIVTNTTSVTVWECLSKGEPLDHLLEVVPDEFRDWIENTAMGLEFRHDQICDYVQDEYQEVRLRLDEIHGAGEWTRKNFAAAIKDNPYRAVLFLVMDGRPISDHVWKLIKPERTYPFKQEKPKGVTA